MDESLASHPLAQRKEERASFGFFLSWDGRKRRIGGLVWWGGGRKVGRRVLQVMLFTLPPIGQVVCVMVLIWMIRKRIFQ